MTVITCIVNNLIVDIIWHLLNKFTQDCYLSLFHLILKVEEPDSIVRARVGRSLARRRKPDTGPVVNWVRVSFWIICWKSLTKILVLEKDFLMTTFAFIRTRNPYSKLPPWGKRNFLLLLFFNLCRITKTENRKRKEKEERGLWRMIMIYIEV